MVRHAIAVLVFLLAQPVARATTPPRPATDVFRAGWAKILSQRTKLKQHTLKPKRGVKVAPHVVEPVFVHDRRIAHARLLGRGDFGMMLRLHRTDGSTRMAKLLTPETDPLVDEATRLGVQPPAIADATVESLNLLSEMSSVGPAEGFGIAKAKKVNGRLLFFERDVLGLDVGAVLKDTAQPYDVRAHIYNMYQLRARELLHGLKTSMKVTWSYKDDPEIFPDELATNVLAMAFKHPDRDQHGQIIIKPDGFILNLETFDMTLVDPF